MSALTAAARWGWRASWILVADLALLGAHALWGERVDLFALYLTLAVVALIGQLLARPTGSGE